MNESIKESIDNIEVKIKNVVYSSAITDKELYKPTFIEYSGISLTEDLKIKWNYDGSPSEGYESLLDMYKLQIVNPIEFKIDEETFVFTKDEIKMILLGLREKLDNNKKKTNKSRFSEIEI
jgi:hypothetical protein